MKKSTVLLSIGTGLFGAASGASYAAFQYFGGRAPVRTDGDPSDEDPEYRDFYCQYLEAKENLSSCPMEPASIMSFDGLTLRGKLYHLTPGTKKVILACHGYRSGGLRDMARFASLYRELGFDVLFISQRSHEDSEGKYITFGHHEEKDGIRWCKKLIELYGDECEIVLHGISMGAATVLMMSGDEELPVQVKCCIADSSYDNMINEGRTIMKELPKPLLDPMLFLMNGWCRLLGGYTLKTASPVNSVTHAHVPILFIHGDSDTFVPREMLDPITDACNADYEVLTVPGAGHVGSFLKDEEAYSERFSEFVSRHLE